MSDPIDVITNTLHGWHNPSCPDCRMRAAEVIGALTAAGFVIAAKAAITRKEDPHA